MFGRWIKRRRRERVLRAPFPEAWRSLILDRVAFARWLPEDDRRELERHVRIFLAEKRFEDCGGMEAGDEVRVTIAAFASLLLLHRRETDYFPRCRSVLVYPTAYLTHTSTPIGAEAAIERTDVHAGESWYRGEVILAWEDIERDIADPREGRNVVVHEFAHQLDDETGEANGTPILPSRARYEEWARVLGGEYEALVARDAQGEDTWLDPYGAESPAEFFAVVTECFFTVPRELKEMHPELYLELQRFYEQDPAALAPAAERERSRERRGSRSWRRDRGRGARR